MFGVLFHDEYSKDDISTQFNALGSLLKCPGWGGEGPQPLKIKICNISNLCFRGKHLPLCAGKPHPLKTTKQGSVSLPGSLSPLSSFRKA